MINSPLLNIIGTFTIDEMQQFGQYVNSPFFNKNKAVIKLFDSIKRVYPDLKSEKLKKESVFKTVNPEAPYNDGYMRSLMFKLSKLAENFLAYKVYENFSVYGNFFLIKAFNDRSLDSHFLKEIKSIASKIKLAEMDEDIYYWFNQVLEKQKLIYNERNSKDQRIALNETREFEESIAVNFLVNILDYYLYLINKSSIIQYQYQLKLLDEVLQFADKFKHIPYINIGVLGIKMMLHRDNERACEEYKTALFKDAQKLSPEKAYNSFTDLENYYHSKGHEGIMNRHELYEVYRKMLLLGTYKLPNPACMSRQKFKNIVITAADLKEFEFVEEFIRDYIDKLEPSQRHNAYNFAMGKLRFCQGRFREALGYAGKVNYENLFYKIEIRDLTLAIFYELNMIDEALAMIDSYKHFLAKDKTLPYAVREGRKNFLGVFLELIKQKEKPNDLIRHTLQQRIENMKYFVNKPWVLDKLKK